MAAQKIRKGDKVVVLSGRDKGKTGEITRAMPKDGKVVVSGVNIATRHRKPTQANPQGGLERREAPMHVSKVAIADPKNSSPLRGAQRPARKGFGGGFAWAEHQHQWWCWNKSRVSF